jgi:hypothetical protein
VHPEDLIPFALARPEAWAPVRGFGVGFADPDGTGAGRASSTVVGTVAMLGE